MDSVTIANMALDAIGARGRISALTEQSVEAAEISLHFDQTVNELLGVHTWSWARRNTALAVFKARSGTPENPSGLTPDPEWPWNYSYQYPSDCVSPKYVLPQNTTSGASIQGVPITPNSVIPADLAITPPVRFLLAGDQDTQRPANPVKVILTNQYQARLIYTARVTDPNIWDELFVMALIGRLAGKICIPLSGDKSLMKLAIATGKQAEDQAKAQDANSGVTVMDWQSEAQAAAGFEDPTSSSDYVGLSPVEIS